MRSSSLEAEHGPVGHEGQGLQRRPFFGEGLIDDPLGRCVHAWVGDRVEPMAELVVEIREISKDSDEKEVLAARTERTLYLSRRLSAIGPAGAGLKAEMAREVDQGAIIDDKPVLILA